MSFPAQTWNFHRAFTLIELLVAVAILGVITAATYVAINPAKRAAQTRDAVRLDGIGLISRMLEEYYTTHEKFPDEAECDSSIGSDPSSCPPLILQTSWSTSSNIYLKLVGEGFVRSLPKDPINNNTYHFRYEPRSSTEGPCNTTGVTCKYWVGGLLETPPDPTKPYFRCSDVASGFAPTGCLFVENWYQ